MQFTLVRAIPKKFCTQWVDLLTDIALEKMIDTMENEARRAFKRYQMVKATLIKPVNVENADETAVQI